MIYIELTLVILNIDWYGLSIRYRSIRLHAQNTALISRSATITNYKNILKNLTETQSHHRRRHTPQ